jgi:hypothetical protein
VFARTVPEVKGIRHFMTRMPACGPSRSRTRRETPFEPDFVTLPDPLHQHQPNDNEMKTMKHCAALFTICLTASLLPSASVAEDAEWVQLFNGKDLTGWTPKITGYELGENFGNTFRVEDGLLKVRYDQYNGEFKGRFGHLFFNQPFSHYRFRVEYRFVGEQCPGGPGWAYRNSGVMFHGQDPATMRKDQEFPVSIEAQILGGDGKNERTTGNLCTPGTNVFYKNMIFLPHCTKSSSKTYHGDQWVTLELEVNGDGVIKHLHEGEVVLEYSQPQYDPRDADAKRLITDENNLLIKGGTISLQSESHPIDFRKVEIQVLEK